MTDQPSRRAILAACPTVAAFAAIGAGAAATSLSPALAEAMERHRAAQSVVDAALAADPQGNFPDDVVIAEGDAFAALCETPCANDGEFAVKMKHLIAH